MTNPIAIARNQQIHVVEESTRGTLALPTTTTLVIAAGQGNANQQPSFTNSPEIQASRDVIARFQDRTPPGSWSFPVLLRPSGTAGTAPQEKVLMKCLLGKETIVSATTVTYSPLIAKPSFSMWLKKDHTIFWISGATVGSAKFSLATKGGAQCDLSGKFMKMGWAGTCATVGLLASGATAITVVDAKKFTVGSLFEIVEGGVVKHNSNAGYLITAVTVATNTLTIAAPGLEEEITAASVIRGWLPTSATITSVPIENRKGSALIGGAATAVQSMSVDITDDPTYLEEEITTSGYPEEYVEVERAVSGVVQIYFRQDDVKFFTDGYLTNKLALKMIVGTTAGQIVEISMPTAVLSVPEVQESDPTVALSMPFQALGNLGEDSISIIYK